MKKKCCSKKSFTLIELLVVIAIIAILAAMLMPALQKARSRSVAADCNSRMKQLGQCILTYIGDCNDFFPPIIHAARATETIWSHRLVVLKYITPIGIRVCPAHNRLKASIREGVINKPEYSGGSQNISYGLNNHLSNSTLYGSASLPYPRLPSAKITQIKKPGQTIMLGETIKYYTDGGFSEYGHHTLSYRAFYNDEGMIRVDHDGTTNVAWVDGHTSVERIPNEYVAYEVYPFANGSELKHKDNYFDRY